MKYKALNNNVFVQDNFSVVPLRQEDIYLIKDWRNAQIDILRQKTPLTDILQLNYYINVIKPLYSQLYPVQILFSYLNNKKCIGYGGFTNIDWEARRAELSFLLNTDHVKNHGLYETEFTIFINLMKRVMCEELDFNRIFTETYDIRPSHISILEKNSFRLEGRMYEHVKVNNKFVDSLIHGFLKKYGNTEK